MEYQVIITANGSGERMKGITDLPKFSLHYKGKRILEHLLDVFPTAKVLTHYEIPYINQDRIIKCTPTNSRRETLEFIKDMENVLIVDCDIYVPKNINFVYIIGGEDFMFWKHSDNNQSQKIPAGLYFLKKVAGQDLETIPEGTQKIDTIHLGTIPEYYDAVLGE